MPELTGGKAFTGLIRPGLCEEFAPFPRWVGEELQMTPTPQRYRSSLEYLDGQHAAFRFLEQEADSDSIWMSIHGHPKTQEYRRYRAIFDALSYASGIGARFLAFYNRRNSVEYFAPRLQVALAPVNIPGVSGELGPNQDRLMWTQYLRTVAQLGWPTGCDPALYTGKWMVKTDINDFYDDIRKTKNAQAELIEPGYWQVVCANPSEGGTERMYWFVREFFKDAPLPPPARLWQSDEADEPITSPFWSGG